MLNIEHYSKTYPGGHKAVDDLSIQDHHPSGGGGSDGLHGRAYSHRRP